MHNPDRVPPPADGASPTLRKIREIAFDWLHSEVDAGAHETMKRIYGLANDVLSPGADGASRETLEAVLEDLATVVEAIDGKIMAPYRLREENVVRRVRAALEALPRAALSPAPMRDELEGISHTAAVYEQGKRDGAAEAQAVSSDAPTRDGPSETVAVVAGLEALAAEDKYNGAQGETCRKAAALLRALSGAAPRGGAAREQIAFTYDNRLCMEPETAARLNAEAEQLRGAPPEDAASPKEET